MRAIDLFLRFGVGALVLCLAAMSGFAQETGVQLATSDETASPRTAGNFYSLAGTVINEVTGEPVRRAAVQISGQNRSVAITDAGGRFVLDGLAEGDVFLTATKPGYYDDETSHTTAVRVGKDAPAVVLKLTPSGVISGRVNTKDEQPLEEFQISFWAQQNLEGRLVWLHQPYQVARTNEDGEFRVAGLEAGTYYIAVEQSGGTLSQKGVANAREQIFAKVFYPDASDLNSATPIEISPGREVEANFTLSPEPIYQVSGSVSGGANVATGLTFTRKSGDGTDFRQTAELQDGRFQVKIPAGAYNVDGTTSDGVELSTQQAMVIRSDETGLQVSLHAATSIPVEIEKENGTAGSERRVAVQETLPDGCLRLDPVSPSRFDYGASFWRARAGGISNVAPGTYRLQINMPGELWVTSVMSGGVDLLSDDLTIAEGDQPAPIKVTLRDGAGMVSGTVTPAGDSGGVLVLLVQPHGSRNSIHATRAMQGSFAIQGVPPGDYAILALGAGDRLEYADPEVLNPYLSDAEHINVRPHGTVTVNLGLTSVKR